MMSYKRNSTTYLLVLIISLTSFLSVLTFVQGNTWGESTEITSNVGSEAPEIDGIMEESWSTANLTYGDFGSDIRITLYVQHFNENLYFLIIAKFAAEADEETFSIYLSDSNDTEDIFDKKQITMQNASESGNESSTATDLFKPEESDEYLADLELEGFLGAAKYHINGTDEEAYYRYYEYEIAMTPSNASASEDTEIIGFFNYAIRIGYNSSSNEENLSDVILVQVGPKGYAEDKRIGELDIDTKLYINIVLMIVTVIFGSFGIALITSKSKIGNLKQEDL